MTALRTALVGFAAGALSVLVFHQGTVALLHLAGLVPNAPFQLRPVPPLGVPQLGSIAFWGGVWGIVIAAILAARPGWPPMLVGLLVGAVGCVLVGFTVVAALRGQPLMGGFDPGRWWRSMLINGAFGWGVGVLLVVARRLRIG
ncbi:hypothetical protein [Roseomonas rosulenta]|uniref:hypothetical protein n=1 Tax=Roseomonas rosulenta TaxID=2748667 RepID=UPI001E2C09B0|nr:hypothetical protein [Roseomonas rosulenta]